MRCPVPSNLPASLLTLLNAIRRILNWRWQESLYLVYERIKAVYVCVYIHVKTQLWIENFDTYLLIGMYWKETVKQIYWKIAEELGESILGWRQGTRSLFWYKVEIELEFLDVVEKVWIKFGTVSSELLSR